METKRETSCYKHVLGKCHESVASPHNLLTFMLRIVNHSFQQVEFGRNSIKKLGQRALLKNTNRKRYMEFPNERIQISMPATNDIHEHSLSAFQENKHTGSTKRRKWGICPFFYQEPLTNVRNQLSSKY